MNLEQAEYEAKAQCAAMRSALEGFVNAIDTRVNAGLGFPLPNTIELMANGHAALALDAGRGYVPADKARVIAEALKRHVRHRDWCATWAGKQCCDCTDGMKVARELGLLEEK